jgi:RHS repeat-associated protein
VAHLGVSYYNDPTLITGASTAVARYTYDAMDRRIGVVEGATTRWTVYDGMSPLLDFNGSGTQTARYLNGPSPSGVDAVLARETSGGTVAWYLPDRLGTIRDIVDNTGAVIDHIDYGVFGNVVVESNASAGDAFKFAGMRYDAASGLFYDNARWYDAVTGRFVSQDPIGFNGRDVNLFRYANNGPSYAIDPTGTLNWQEFWTVFWNPFSAYQGSKARDRARELAPKTADALGCGGTAHNGPEDAIRHALWNAFMAQTAGPVDAKKFADAHEADSASPDETAMDLWNNAVGRDIGYSNPYADEATIARLVGDAFVNGRLRVLRPSGSGAVPPGTPLLPSGSGCGISGPPHDPGVPQYPGSYYPAPPLKGPPQYPGSPYPVGGDPPPPSNY